MVVSGNLRWLVAIVGDADRTATFYETVFNWQRWWDNQIELDTRFHPIALSTMAKRADVRLVVMGEGDFERWNEDYNAPSIALTEYVNDDIGDIRDHKRERLGRGDFVLMIHADDIDGIYERAMASGGRSSSMPTDWIVPHPEGLGDIGFRTASFFDPEGNYIEVSKKRFCPTWEITPE